MATVSSDPGVGPLLREWRERRRMTQLELALDAGVSARHLSFVETGRSKPGREMLLRVLEQLKVPFRERNQLLLTVGHAPAFPERSLEHPELAPVREALDLILTGHEPYPAIAVDRAWNLVAANSPVLTLTESANVDPALLEPPINAVRVSLHPRGLAPLIVNLGAWRAFFRERLERQLAITGDDDLRALIEEVAGYPTPELEHDPAFDPGANAIVGPLKLRVPDGRELSFLGMFATFDAPFEVTSSELAIELLFPTDRATADALKNLARDRQGP
jgi:transcriptional regulator with XRE-family HTH domain